MLSWVATLATARLLAPADYGIFGMATVYLSLMTMLSEFGLGSAVVNLRQMTTTQLEELNGLAALLGAGAYALTLALAWPLSLFFRYPELFPVLAVLGLTACFASLQTVRSGVLQRDLGFKRLSIIEAAQAATQALITVALAFMGFRYWSLVLGGVMAQFLSTIMLSRAVPIGFRRPTGQGLGHALGFGRDVLLSRLGYFAYSNADQLIVGRLLGAASLGAYTLALSFSAAPLDKISGLVTRVLPSYFSATKHDSARMRRYLLLVTQGLSLVTFPASLGLAMIADHLLVGVLGAKWGPAVVPMQILCVLAVMRSVLVLLPSILIARNKTRAVLKNSLLASALLIGSFAVGARYGLPGVAVAWLIFYPVVSGPLLVAVLHEIDLSFVKYVASLLPAITGSVVMVAAVYAVRTLLAADFPAIPRLALEILAGAVAYSLAMFPVLRHRGAAFLAAMRGGSVA